MRLRSLLVSALALATASAALVAAPAHAATVDDPAVSSQLTAEIKKEGTVRSIIELKPGASVNAVATDTGKASAKADVIEEKKAAGFFVAELDKKALDELKKDTRIQAIYKDELSAPSLDASTKVIGSDKANEAGWTGKGFTVAVLDTGIDRDHPFFAGRIVDEACFSSNYSGHGAASLCPNGQSTQQGAGAANAEIARCVVQGANRCYHGSHVAGIAAGKKTTGAPSNGVAPEAGILPIQVFSQINSETLCGAGKSPCLLSYTSDQMFALAYVASVAKARNVVAANMSLGGRDPYSNHCDTGSMAAMKAQFDALIALGTAPVVAAGNDGFPSAVSFPACISSAVAVGATDDNDALATFTNRGKLLDLFAPGVEINSSVPNNAYGVIGGTSMAAPHVAGAFAVMKQAHPSLSVPQILAKLQNTGKSIRYGQVTTKRIDLAKATPPKATPTPTPTPTVTPTGKPTTTPTATPTGKPTVRPTVKPTPTVTPTHTPAPTSDPDPKIISMDPDPEPVPDTCTRGRGTKPLSSKAWAREMLKSQGSLSDRTLLCYLSITQNGSSVFPEVTNAATLGKAYKVLNPKSKSAKALLDRELLAAWLNYSHGVYNASAKVHGSTTLKKAIGVAETYRVKGGTATQLKKTAVYLYKHVNK
ncbi:S8 family peptidase [Nonomuraea cavernae]|uniref:S8 family peptidase n=1 Tax=Nonomuraea cavernae TaxID=2045107 RepID=UPI0033DD01D5